MPDCAFHKLILEGEEVINSLALGGEMGDVVCLEAVNELAHVVGLALDCAEHRAVANGAVGAEENEVVGEVCCRDAEVGTWLFGPDVL